jgi:hypothetical protein
MGSSSMQRTERLKYVTILLLCFERNEIDDSKVTKGDNYEDNSENWDTRFDHNHLRITRIIRCLRVLGLEEEAKAFLITLENSTTRVSSRSREFWRRAAERDLNLRPDLEIDDESDNTIGPKFLREYELERKVKQLAKAGHATKADQSGSEDTEESQVEQEKKNKLSENAHVTEDPSQLETAQGHDVTKDGKKESPAS